jgi:hypothetical protein
MQVGIAAPDSGHLNPANVFRDLRCIAAAREASYTPAAQFLLFFSTCDTTEWCCRTKSDDNDTEENKGPLVGRVVAGSDQRPRWRDRPEIPTSAAGRPDGGGIEERGDRYPFLGGVKGSTTLGDPGKFILIVTSNYWIEQWFGREQDRAATRERFSEIAMSQENRERLLGWRLNHRISPGNIPATIST